jgi:hypothetical protein
MAKGSDSSKARTERRKRRQKEIRANDWRINPTAPTPYEEWKETEVADSYRGKVEAALSSHPTLDISYQKDKGRASQRLTVDDLAVGLFAVACVGRKGIAYGQLQRAFKVAGLGWSRPKAPAIFRALLALGLVERTGNYSTGSKGNQYKVIRSSNVKGVWE